MRYILALVPAALLAACGGDGDTTAVDTSDPEAMAEAAADLARPQAGEYRQTAEVVEFSLPGIPEDQAGMMREMMTAGATQARTFCITEEEAEQGFERVIREMQQGDETCSFSRFEAGSNAIDAVMNCSATEGQQVTMQMTGTVSETEQDMTVTMEAPNPMPGGTGQLRMVLHSTAERIGDCSAEAG